MLSAGVLSPALISCLGLLSTGDRTLGITTSGLAWALEGGKRGDEDDSMKSKTEAERE